MLACALDAWIVLLSDSQWFTISLRGSPVPLGGNEKRDQLSQRFTGTADRPSLWTTWFSEQVGSHTRTVGAECRWPQLNNIRFFLSNPIKSQTIVLIWFKGYLQSIKFALSCQLATPSRLFRRGFISPKIKSPHFSFLNINFGSCTPNLNCPDHK